MRGAGSECIGRQGFAADSYWGDVSGVVEKEKVLREVMDREVEEDQGKRQMEGGILELWCCSEKLG